jgi:hypothetical protein
MARKTPAIRAAVGPLGKSVRNYTSYGKYRPAPLRNHNKTRNISKKT